MYLVTLPENISILEAATSDSSSSSPINSLVEDEEQICGEVDFFSLF